MLKNKERLWLIVVLNVVPTVDPIIILKISLIRVVPTTKKTKIVVIKNKNSAFSLKMKIKNNINQKKIKGATKNVIMMIKFKKTLHKRVKILINRLKKYLNK